mmetsp:Transcript_5759/g.9662  ORF Transcript_5759/g.9662 Transcript_5759/m.9662 type:complete len:193 (+) Transcript_5759:15-593(+)
MHVISSDMIGDATQSRQLATGLARQLNAAGLACNKSGDTKRAADLFIQAHTADPGRAPYLISAANMYLKIGDRNRAQQLYSRARNMKLTPQQVRMVASKEGLLGDAAEAGAASEEGAAARITEIREEAISQPLLVPEDTTKQISKSKAIHPTIAFFINLFQFDGCFGAAPKMPETKHGSASVHKTTATTHIL